MNWKATIIKGREPFSGYSHLIGSLLALAGGFALLRIETCSAWLWYVRMFYVLSLFGALFSSAAYHLVVGSPSLIDRLRNIDHWCIRGLILGTFAPLAFEVLPIAWAATWLSALAVVMIFDAIMCRGRGRAERRGRVAISYILMGCSALLPVPFLWAEHHELILWVSSGSLFYVIGAYCYLRKFPRGAKVLNFHEVWHICVVVGAFVHYTAIYHISAASL